MIRLAWAHPRSAPLAIAVLLAVVTSAAAQTQDVHDTQSSALHEQVEGLLRRHCWRCHGGEESIRGGLDLTTRDAAARGGDSGSPILTDNVNENELYLRITDADPTVRMPKGEPPLDEAEIAMLKQWLENGAAWPAPEIRPSQPESSWTRLMNWGADAAEWMTAVRPFIAGGVVWSLLFLALGRLQRRWREQEVDDRPPSAVGAALRKPLGVAALLVGYAMLSLGGWLTIIYQQRDALARENDAFRRRLNQEDFEPTPRLLRPSHPRQLAGVYYRGNCERSHKLFNYGNYLTATMRIRLCDRNGTAVEYNSPLPEDGLFVEFEMERAPHTSERLYSERMLRSVFFAHRLPVNDSMVLTNEQVEAFPTAKRLPMEIVEPSQKWRALLAVEDPAANTRGSFHLCKGKQSHFAIVYDLKVEDGKLHEHSEIWMTATMIPGMVAAPDYGDAPWLEWFDHRPLPAVDAPQEDVGPKLLGEDDYLLNE